MVTFTAGRLLEPKALTTSVGISMPAAVLPVPWISARIFIGFPSQILALWGAAGLWMWLRDLRLNYRAVYDCESANSRAHTAEIQVQPSTTAAVKARTTTVRPRPVWLEPA